MRSGIHSPVMSLGMTSITILPFTWGQLRNRNRRIVHATRTVALAVNHRVLQEFRIVALREVGALMCAARLLAPQRRIDHRFRDVEHALQLQRGDALGVERATLV